jgi:hypothetical protein
MPASLEFRTSALLSACRCVRPPPTGWLSGMRARPAGRGVALSPATATLTAPTFTAAASTFCHVATFR